ncbi:hypothetical protein RFI_26429 [Reticulomyxa filosa]|uniref:Uncharacterized protein n=1 Tax=Reticulomyxa filosa TaxID=46433 RepID=X6MBY8_RETFI|nr:hypothetical protein RFI_26429 [Reticulomyxa filosa]|eukprot:ETO10947.1 hypothetical protein RFI_26429 [Reticulomyxa filosa]
MLNYAKCFKLSKVLKGGSYNIDKLKFSADGRKFYLLAEDGVFEIWGIALGKKIQIFNKRKKLMQFEWIIGSNMEIQFSLDCKYIAELETLDSGKQIQRLEEKIMIIQIAALLTARKISLWDMKLSKKVKEIDIDNSLKTKLSLDGRFLAYSFYNTIQYGTWNQKICKYDMINVIYSIDTLVPTIEKFFWDTVNKRGLLSKKKTKSKKIVGCGYNKLLFQFAPDSNINDNDNNNNDSLMQYRGFNGKLQNTYSLKETILKNFVDKVIHLFVPLILSTFIGVSKSYTYFKFVIVLFEFCLQDNIIYIIFSLWQR